MLHNNAFPAEGAWICGTRGWMLADPEAANHDAKIMRRELMRLEMSLKAAGEGEKLCFLHYPPKTKAAEFTQLIELMKDYGVRRCWYGHIHRMGSHNAFVGEYKGIEFRLIASDLMDFTPRLIEPCESIKIVPC